MNATVFGDVAKSFIAQGGFPARDVLPLIPPGAKIGENSVVDPSQVGKIPGRYLADKGEWVGLKGPWPTFGIPEKLRNAAARWPTANVGLRATDFPAVDIDVATVEARDLITNLVETYLGKAPVRVRGGAPRALHVFRRDGEEHVRKLRLKFADSDGVEHVVEVLGSGQQYVIAGIHPSGTIYEWLEEQDPEQRKTGDYQRDLIRTAVGGLEAVSFDKLKSFMDAVRQAVTDRGWKVIKYSSPSYGEGAEGPGLLVNEIEPLADKALVLQALNSFENTEETLPDREDFVRLVASLKHVMGRESEEIYPEFLEWATRHGFAEPGWVDHIWSTMTAVRVQPDYFWQIARRLGKFRGDAALDFADEKMAENADAAQAAARATMTEQEEVEREVASMIVQWAAEKSMIVTGTGEILDYSAFNSTQRLGARIAPAGLSGVKAASNILINKGLIREVVGVTYLPGRDKLVQWTREGRSGLFYNRWHTTNHTLPDSVTDEDVRPWLDHAELLLPDDRERGILLDYLAHIVQKRGQKVRWAPILIGKQGTGKDLLVRPVTRFLGHNAQEVGPEMLMAQFNGFLEREFIVVEEMVQHDKRDAYQKIKALISGTASDTLMIENKYQQAYAVPNTVNLMFFSNLIDAIRLEDDDRRFLVLSSPARHQTEAYYNALADKFYVEQSGWRKVVRWLQQRDISKFNASGRAPDTDAKTEMRDAQVPFLSAWMRQQMRDGCFKDRTVMSIGDLFLALQSDFNLPLPSDQRRKVYSKQTVAAALAYAGWQSLPNQVRVKDGSRQRLWVRDDTMAKLPPDQLRARLEAETAGKVSVSDF